MSEGQYWPGVVGCLPPGECTEQVPAQAIHEEVYAYGRLEWEGLALDLGQLVRRQMRRYIHLVPGEIRRSRGEKTVTVPNGGEDGIRADIQLADVETVLDLMGREPPVLRNAILALGGDEMLVADLIVTALRDNAPLPPSVDVTIWKAESIWGEKGAR